MLGAPKKMSGGAPQKPKVRRKRLSLDKGGWTKPKPVIFILLNFPHRHRKMEKGKTSEQVKNYFSK